MNLILAFFKLIRLKNLLIVVLTQLLIWYFVLLPFGGFGEFPIFLSIINFSLLCLSTALIAAAGYIINDYFDVAIDLINKPNEVIIGKFISNKSAIFIYIILNAIALLFAFILAWKLNQLSLSLIQISCIVLLWLYATKFKREFMKGNILVAFLVAFTILILAVYEPFLYHFSNLKLFIRAQEMMIVNPLGLIIFYAYFAFMITWMREIVKDMEDFKGDSEDGCTTMPIRIGLQKSQRFVSILGVFAILPLIIVAFKLWKGSWRILSIYIFVALVISIIYLLFYLPKKTTQKHYHKASQLLKLIMLLGLFALFIYWFLQ